MGSAEKDPFQKSMASASGFYSIGYGNRDIKEFLELLKLYKVDFLVDIRTTPHSKYNKSFSRESLERKLTERNIRYIFMGDTLGGRPRDSSCYVDGYVDYGRVEKKDFFLSGIKRLKKAWKLKFQVAFMCSEKKPHECHRSKLLGEYMKKIGIYLQHIDENQNLVSQENVIKRLSVQMPLDMENCTVFRSRNKYI